MFPKQSLFFLSNNLTFDFFLLCDYSPFLPLLFSLGSVNCKFLLPQLFDVSFVLQLTHTSLLGIHLFEALVFSEFLSHLCFEFFFHTPFFFEPLCFQLQLIILCSLQLCFLTKFFFCVCSFFCAILLFGLLHLQIIAQVLDVLRFRSSFCFFLSQFSENRFSLSFSCLFKSLKFICTFLLL